MEKEVLYRFFDGKASKEEKEAIHCWLKADTANEKELLRDREFFDALLLTGHIRANTQSMKQSRKRFVLPSVSTLLREVVKVAAVIAITLSVGWYFYSQEKEQLLSAMNTVTVPAGQRVHVTLPDGTDVWLNACSELIYPAVFQSSDRSVQLKGEGFFDVTHNEKQPFLVKTQSCTVEVLGTKFNVEAYEDTDDFSVSLLEGLLRVRDRANSQQAALLKPGQAVQLKDNRWQVSNIADYDHFRWREGLLCFKNLGFYELMERFEKCYDITIIVDNPKLKEYMFSGKFRISDGLDNALRVLQRDVDYTFERNEENTIVTIK